MKLRGHTHGAYTSDLPTPDPTVFGDALALKTEWTPLGSAGSAGTSRTHTLRVEGGELAQLVTPLTFTLFGGLVAIFGLGIAAYGFMDTDAGFGTILGRIGIGFVISVGGVIMAWLSRSPLQFDRHSGEFSRGRPFTNPILRALAPYRSCRLDTIRALQILVKRTSKTTGGTSGAYLSFELNLVLEDGSRLNVLDHGDGSAMREDAARLGRFLERPVWDATEGR